MQSPPSAHVGALGPANRISSPSDPIESSYHDPLLTRQPCAPPSAAPSNLAAPFISPTNHSFPFGPSLKRVARCSPFPLTKPIPLYRSLPLGWRHTGHGIYKTPDGVTITSTAEAREYLVSQHSFFLSLFSLSTSLAATTLFLPGHSLTLIFWTEDSRGKHNFF